jgi:hypothetical protein
MLYGRINNNEVSTPIGRNHWLGILLLFVVSGSAYAEQL